MKTAALVFLMLTVPAMAQAPKPSGDTETVYDFGQRTRDWELSQRFLQSLVRPSFVLEDQFATWKRPVCLQVTGMAFPDAYFVEQHIADIARKIGAPLERGRACTPNTVIFVSSDPQLVLDTMKAKKPFLFAGSSPDERKVHYPAQVWYYAVDRDYRGHYWPDSPTEESTNFDPSRVLTGVPQMASNKTHLLTGIQPELRVAIILVDSAAIGNMPLASLADYLALMSLSQAPATGRCQPAPSIANLFLADCGADLHTTSLSNVDLALLTSLYQTPDEPEKMQKIRIINNMRHDLEAEGKK